MQVSVIIPVYNQAKYLESAIQSALSQIYQDHEIIIVDDGSTDNTPLVANQFSSSIRYIRQENKGLSGARNTGIRNANGNFIALLDSDDQWLPEFLVKMMALANQFPEAAVYYCQAHCIDADGHELPQVLGGPVRPPETMYQTLLRSNFLIPSTIIMKRSVVIKAGLFDQSLRSCEDWDLWLRLLPKQKFIGTNDSLVRYRLHGASLSTNINGMHNAARNVVEKNFGNENGKPQYWAAEKRRAFGGLYCYQALTFIQRQDNWQAAAQQLIKGLHIDPTLAIDLNLFYDLVLGCQPVGLRGTEQHLDLKKNTDLINCILKEVFEPSGDLQKLRRRTYGTVHYALGLVAYNTGQLNLCRKHLLEAIYCRPELCFDFRLLGALVKTNINSYFMKKLKRLRGAGLKSKKRRTAKGG